jgi:flavin-dependent dehydrogenase
MGTEFDVAIIGGGPAGSTAATLLAKAGRSVIVFEKDRFPRFKIGESLLPFSMAALERLGVMEKLNAAGFIAKHGAEITSGCGERDTRFYFKDGFRSKRETALQVTRAEFDKILLDHAREHGAEVHEATTVKDLSFSDDCVLIDATNESRSHRVAASYLLDCSGRTTVLGTKFDLKRAYPGLQKFSVYAHYEGAERLSGIDGTLTRMVRTPDRWFWMIPLTESRVSVGVVMDTALFKGLGLSPEEVLEGSIADLPVMRSRMQGATRVTKVYATGDYSYRNTRLFGNRWILAGDAAGFIDPIFSSGVFLAILGGERAADALHIALDDSASGQREFARYSRRLGKVMNLYLGFVESWYRQEFVETLFNPTQFFDVVPAVNAVLAGNLGKSFALRWRLWLFRLIVALQRVAPISPRLALAPVAGL